MFSLAFSKNNIRDIFSVVEDIKSVVPLGFTEEGVDIAFLDEIGAFATWFKISKSEFESFVFTKKDLEVYTVFIEKFGKTMGRIGTPVKMESSIKNGCIVLEDESGVKSFEFKMQVDDKSSIESSEKVRSKLNSAFDNADLVVSFSSLDFIDAIKDMLVLKEPNKDLAVNLSISSSGLILNTSGIDVDAHRTLGVNEDVSEDWNGDFSLSYLTVVEKAIRGSETLELTLKSGDSTLIGRTKDDSGIFFAFALASLTSTKSGSDDAE